jgi:RNA polymerase sigma-70 factor (ECF subfamily)
MAAAVKGRERAWVARAPESSDGVAWDELVATVHRQMRSLAGARSDLEDLTQMALEQVLRSLPRFRGDGDISTFTYRICVNVVMNHWRFWRRLLRRIEVGVVPDTPDERSGPCQLTLERERAEHLHACLERLSPKKRVVLTLHDLEDLPAPRIAEILDCPEPTVRSRLREARRELTELLARDRLFREPSDGDNP